MIEGARIDHAAHNNDPVGHIHDILQYNEMVQAVVDWVDSNAASNEDEPETVVFSVPTTSVVVSPWVCRGPRTRKPTTAGTLMW